jgi:hypothetical protein
VISFDGSIVAAVIYLLVTAAVLTRTKQRRRSLQPCCCLVEQNVFNFFQVWKKPLIRVTKAAQSKF